MYLRAKIPNYYKIPERYVDAGLYPVAVVGTRLYQLARLVPASSRMDMEGADFGPDDRSLPADVRRHHALYRPYAHAIGHRRLRSGYFEHLHTALPLYVVSGARPRETLSSRASYLII